MYRLQKEEQQIIKFNLLHKGPPHATYCPREEKENVRVNIFFDIKTGFMSTCVPLALYSCFMA